MGSHSIGVLGIVLLAGLAPYQCGGPDPEEPSGIEESAGDALYKLAGEFEKASDRAGRVRVLRFLIARYPKNRFATTAREDLLKLGEAAPDESSPAVAGSAVP